MRKGLLFLFSFLLMVGTSWAQNIVNASVSDGRSTLMPPQDIEKKLWQDCEVKITKFGTPTYSVEPGGYEGALVITNDIAIVAPDSIFPIGETIITWTATDTLGASISCQQKVNVSFHDCPPAIDGSANTYRTARLGSNCICWTTSNMKTKKYSDGRDIDGMMSYASENYSNASENVHIFGYLYDWYAAVDTATNSLATIAANHDNGIRTQGICPDGWFLPLDDDFEA